MQRTTSARSALRGVPRDKTVEIRIAPSSVTVGSDQAHHLALVINELATNTVKHALAGQQSVEQDAEGIDITSDVDVVHVAASLFRAHIGQGAHKLPDLRA